MQAKFITLEAADGHKLDAYRADPDSDAIGSIVILHEIFGVNTHIQAVVQDYAQLGYSVLAPALYDRVQRKVQMSNYSEIEISIARGLRAQSRLDHQLLDIQAATRELSSDRPIAIIGYCWGGTLAWAAAATFQQIKAAVVYYGGAIAQLKLTPQCPVLGHFGEQDPLIPVDEAEALESTYDNVKIFTYPTGHGFNCNLQKAYDAPSSELALQRTLKFFNDHLPRTV